MSSKGTLCISDSAVKGNEADYNLMLLLHGLHSTSIRAGYFQQCRVHDRESCTRVNYCWFRVFGDDGKVTLL